MIPWWLFAACALGWLAGSLAFGIYIGRKLTEARARLDIATDEARHWRTMFETAAAEIEDALARGKLAEEARALLAPPALPRRLRAPDDFAD